MKIAFSDTHGFERDAFTKANEKDQFDFDFLDGRLTAKSARLIEGSDVVCSFVNDKIDDECLKALQKQGVKLLALRCAGYNHVDLIAAKKYNIAVCRVPGYSPYAVAEFAVGLLLTLNRKIHRSFARVRELNFSLEGLVGFDLHGKTVGVVGAGRIGCIFAKIMTAFGCRVLIYDVQENVDLEKNPAISYVDLNTLYRESDIISLHVPLTPETKHLIDTKDISLMKEGVFIVNTSRGALINATALIEGLKSHKVGGAALDVYEEEEGVFFQDLSDKILDDDTLARLLTFPNTIVTSHQAFLTKEALNNIATTTLDSIREFRQSGKISALKQLV